MNLPKFSKELEAAKKAALLAGKEIMEVYKQDFEVELKEDNSPVTIADKKANEVIIKELKHFKYKVISEESINEKLTNLPTWIIDPLDGTKSFVRKDGNFSVMIALLKNQKEIVSVVYSPVKEEIYFAEKGKGAYLEYKGEIKKLKPSKIKKLKEFTILASVSRFSEKAQNFTKFIESKKIIQIGSLGVKAYFIASGRGEVYFNFNSMAVWDVCAPKLILEEAGGKFTDIQGKKLVCNKNNFENGIVAINSNNKEFFKKLKEFQKLNVN